MEVGPPLSRTILGVRVDATSYDDAAERVMRWAMAGESRYVCLCNVHMVMEAQDDPSMLEIVNGADLVTPDGVPLVWGLRALGIPTATRVYGPTLTPIVCARAAATGAPIALFGSDEDTLKRMQAELRKTFPALKIALAESPPFRPLLPEEEDAFVDRLSRSGAKLLFVGLGCPKQERFMARMKPRVRMPMLGVGAAFDFIAGTKAQAPAVIQNAGLEWLFRLAVEPRRLFRRYTRHNPRFVALFARQLARERRR